MRRRPAPKTGPSGITIKIDLMIEVTPRKVRRALVILGMLASLATAAKTGSVIGFLV